MLFTFGHGQTIVVDTGPVPAGIGIAAAGQGDVIPLDAVVETAARPGAIAAAIAPAGGTFAYYFPGAATIPENSGTPDALDAIANAMIEEDNDPVAQNSTIPPIFTYLGQFIDHDITAGTDRDSTLSVIAGPIVPIPQTDVEAGLFNLRDGSLRLDSVYGDTIGQGPFATKLSKLMRHPTLTHKMRLAIPAPTDAPPLPAEPDRAADLPRLGFLVERGDITQAELDALSPELKKTFLNPDGTPYEERAIIGDGRNDENLLVAQLHMSMLRFHNKLVDAVGDFEAARKLMRWHYQWLIVNEYLPTVCDPAIVADVVARKAPLYAEFFAAHGAEGSTQLPLPLEFSVAAFRFGHSMIRGSYDHNRFFGEPVPGSNNIIDSADFGLLFDFTGNGKMKGTGIKLPHNWVIEWERFVAIDPTRPRRAARKIDTHLAPPLKDMVNEDPGVFKHLAQRNLRRGYRLSLPTAQACIAALAGGHYPTMAAISNADLISGQSGQKLDAAGLAYATPLWFYVLKEAEVAAGGQHLGPLGSVLVADTLLGLIVQDKQSYWHGGANGTPWSPTDAGLAQPVDSLKAMLRFAGMLQ
ncbi:MAG: heme peroxidase family protein [Devosia sp.]|uniref:peroxidase family protein n=1 Tax=Devosia sp. TaxID=1871048 RepID=UPI00339445A7